jgi:hypothetical protein
MSISISLDWLSFTVKDYEHGKNLLLHSAFGSTWKATTPHYGYTIADESENGVVRSSNPQRLDMGIHFEIPGSALRIMRTNGVDMVKFVGELRAARAKATRIDLAKDAQNEAIDLQAIVKQALNGLYEGRVQSPTAQMGRDGGCTLYMGSWHSDRFARLYDKAVEQKVQGDWKRLEIVNRGDYAKRLLRVLGEPGANWDDVFNFVMKGMFNVQVGNYDKYLQGGSISGLPQLENSTDREKWIEDQVIRAVCEHLIEKPDSEAVASLFRALQGLYGGIKG